MDFFLLLPSNLRSQRNRLHVSVLFLCLPKEKEPKRKGTPPLVPPQAGCPEFMPRMGYSSMLPGLCKLGFASNSAKPFFGSLSGARLRDNGGESLPPNS
jgi:hypothetical protein